MVALDGRGEFCEFLRPVLFFVVFEGFEDFFLFFEVFVNFYLGFVLFVWNWPAVLQYPSLHWLKHVLSS